MLAQMPYRNIKADNLPPKLQNIEVMPQSSKFCEKKPETEGTQPKGLQSQRKMLAMESQYKSISKGAELMSWLKQYKDDEALLTILGTYGLLIHRHELTEEDCDLLTEVLSKLSSKLPNFSLSSCTGSQTLLDRLVESESLPEATKICFAGSKLDEQTANCFVKFGTLFQAEIIVLRSVSASADGLQALRREMENKKREMTKFKGLEIHHNNGISKEGMECMAGIVKDFTNTPLEIAMCYCDITDERLQDFQNSLGSTSLGGIDVCGNRKLTENGFKIIGELVKNNKAHSASLQDCGLDTDKIETFSEACGKGPSLPIVSLNVAHNPQLGPNGMETIKKYVKDFEVENLNVSWCEVNDFDFDFELRSLDVSGNTKCKDITGVAKNVQEELYIRNCLNSKSQLIELAGELAKRTKSLEKLDLRNDRRRSDISVTMFMVKSFKDQAKSLRLSPFAFRDCCLLKT